MGQMRWLQKVLVYVLAAVLVISTLPARPLYAEGDAAGEGAPVAAVEEPTAEEPAPDPAEGEPRGGDDATTVDTAVPAEEEGDAGLPEGNGAEGAPIPEGEPAGPAADGEAPATEGEEAPAGGSEEPDPVRAGIAFDADSFIKAFRFTLESGGVSHQYDLASGQDVDTTADFPDGLARSATYAGDMTIDVRSMAAARGAYPLVPGDTIICTFPSILRPNGTLTGRLRDASADWDGEHGGVGDYRIADGKLTISYDDGYLQEKSGKIIESSIKFSGGFDTSTQTDQQFDYDLAFGNVTIGARFSRLEIVRNLSIEKTGTTSSGFAYVNSDGRITYTLEVKAGQDNTHTLKNVHVTDVFTDGSETKVDLSTMELVSATVDGEDIASRLVPLTDDEGRLDGWNIGNLPAGQVARIVYTIKVDREGMTRAVDAAKQQTPSTDAIEARTIRNTASASAEGVPAVTDDFSMPVRNDVYISKSNGRYDAVHQTQHFTITVTASQLNTYTEYFMPIYDTLSSAPAASVFEKSGVSSVTVKRADGTTMEVPLGAISYPSSREWRACLPTVEPGDVFTIDAYTQVADSYWSQTGSGTVGDGDIWNYVYIGSGVRAGDFYANDLSARNDYSRFGLTKRYLTKNSPSITSDGFITWTITGNEQGKSATPENIAGTTVTDTLGPDQVFPAGTATVTFYNQDGSRAGTDAVALSEGSTSFSYTIPEAFGTCGFTITYRSRVTDWDTYVGPAKSYSNRVSGPWGISTGSSTFERQRVPRLSKRFVRQAEDWSQWKVSIYNELAAGDVLTDTVRNGVTYMYFTPAELAAVQLTIGGVAVDPALYRIEPAGDAQDGRYPSFTITFTGRVAVTIGGATVTPSSRTPLEVSYFAKMVDPAFRTGSRDYYNDARLTVGDTEETDYDFCRRNNTTEVVKQVESSSKGYISWRVRANYYGYTGQPDGTCIVTDTLPAGTEFVSAWRVQGSGSLQVTGTVRNPDGTTTVTIRLSSLAHYEVSKSNTYDGNSNIEFHFIVKARITDEDYLYGSESRDFSFTNHVSLNDRYGHAKEASSTATIHHSAIKKTMTYNESTAPYAQFAVEVNQEKVDLNPDGDMVAIVDESSESLALDPTSISVINATTGDPVDFEIDASGMAENRVTIKVPDEMYVKIVYNAQVLGVTGRMVTVGNTAYFEGHRPGTVSESSISETVRVLKATGQAVSEPMVWLSKRDESAEPLAGATYELSVFDAARGWSVVRDGIQTKGGTAKGVKVESLELGRLYRLVETAAPEGYVLDAAPRYFVLYGEGTVAPVLPEGLAADDVFEGPSGSVITAYNEPYTTVAFEKVDDAGTRLAGARLEVLDATGAVARDAAGSPVEFTSIASGRQEFVLAPGEYRLHEVSAPEGYDRAEDVAFAVAGDRARSVLQDGRSVEAVTMTDLSATTSLPVEKRWRDASDRDGARPASVRVQLVADGEPVDGAVLELDAAGADGTAGTPDDWRGSFDGLPVMLDGARVAYSVRELDVAEGYTVAYTWEGATAVVTNSRDFEPFDLTFEKHWDDDGDARGIRPDAVTVRLVADGGRVVCRVEIRAEGPDGVSGTADDWTAAVAGIPLIEDDHEVVYTVEEELPAGYRLAGEPERTATGFALTNELAPDEVPPEGDASRGTLTATGDPAPLAAAAVLVVLGGALVVLGCRRRRRAGE